MSNITRGNWASGRAFKAPAEHGYEAMGCGSPSPSSFLLVVQGGSACFPSFGAGGHGFRHFPATPGVENYLSWSINGRGQFAFLGADR